MIGLNVFLDVRRAFEVGSPPIIFRFEQVTQYEQVVFLWHFHKEVLRV